MKNYLSVYLSVFYSHLKKKKFSSFGTKIDQTILCRFDIFVLLIM